MSKNFGVRTSPNSRKYLIDTIIYGDGAHRCFALFSEQKLEAFEENDGFPFGRAHANIINAAMQFAGIDVDTAITLLAIVVKHLANGNMVSRTDILKQTSAYCLTRDIRKRSRKNSSRWDGERYRVSIKGKKSIFVFV